MEFKEGDEIEIVSNPRYFWDKIKPGMRGTISLVKLSGVDLIIDIPIVGAVGQHLGKSHFSLIRKVNREIKKSGFAKWYSKLDNL